MNPATMARTRAAFTAAHGGAPALMVSAPGRVNLIGEHTDYTDGFCLPCAIDRGTVVAARARTDREVHVLACDQGGATDSFSLDAPILPALGGGWANYVRGTAAALQAQGIALSGADLVIAGDIPQGAGLSSSASLEVAIGQAFSSLSGPPIDRRVLALSGQRAEHHFAGCQCGIMDQLAAAFGVQGHALLLDCRSLAVEPVPVPADMAIVIIDSKLQRGLVDSEYNLRRAQCAEATRFFGVKALRDVSVDQWRQALGTMPALLARRAGHVISENARVLQAVEALKTGNLTSMGELLRASHRSMRDDFEITVPAIDQLVDLSNQAIGATGGARMTGGGFGGCVVALLPRAQVPEVSAAVQGHYRSPQGLAAEIWVCQASAGARVLPS